MLNVKYVLRVKCVRHKSVLNVKYVLDVKCVLNLKHVLNVKYGLRVKCKIFSSSLRDAIEIYFAPMNIYQMYPKRSRKACMSS